MTVADFRPVTKQPRGNREGEMGPIRHEREEGGGDRAEEVCLFLGAKMRHNEAFISQHKKKILKHCVCEK